MIPFERPEGAAAVAIAVLLAGIVFAAVRGRRLASRLRREGLAGRPEVVADPRVRFWVVLPVLLGAAALLAGIFAVVPIVSELTWGFGYATPAEGLAWIVFDTGLLVWGAIAALSGLLSTWWLRAGIERREEP